MTNVIATEPSPTPATHAVPSAESETPRASVPVEVSTMKETTLWVFRSIAATNRTGLAPAASYCVPAAQRRRLTASSAKPRTTEEEPAWQ